jgi:lambda repressor-like predicted transcriptional regulator
VRLFKLNNFNTLAVFGDVPCVVKRDTRNIACVHDTSCITVGDMSVAKVPADPTERTLWVQFHLRLMGLSFSEIARRHAWHRQSVAKAMRLPSLPQEEAIAGALGMPVRKLFPERYDARGNRLHIVRKTSTRGAQAGRA